MPQIIDNLWAMLLAVILLAAAYLLGSFILRKAKLSAKINQNFNSALAILLGYGLISLAALILSAGGPINKFVAYALLLLIFIFRYQDLFDSVKKISLVPGRIKKYDIGEKTLLAGIIFCFLFYLTSALVPPYRTDALAYHLPEAMGVAAGGLGWLVKNAPGDFFTNLPAGVEVLDAVLYALGGFTPIHLVHYSILLAFLFFLFKLIKEYFDRPKALLAILLIFSLYDLFVNGTNAYVDAVMIAWELSGFLLLLLWSKSRSAAYLVMAGFFYGLALGTKYNALSGILLAGLILLFYLSKDKNSIGTIVKKILYFILPLLAVSGFWYFKNLIFYGNPIYPFYFGHPGFSDDTFRQMTTAVKSFVVDRTIVNFVLLPFIFFFKSYYLVLFGAFISWPFVFLWRKFAAGPNQIIKILTFYIGAYSLLWFFVITQQLKFFYGPMILLMIIFALQLDLVRRFIWERLQPKIIFLQIIFLLALVILSSLAYKVATAKNNYFINVKKADLAYVSGLSDKAEFYRAKNMGDIYQVSQYINANFKNTVWLDIWGSTGFFLSSGNKFTYQPDLIYNGKAISTSTLLYYLQKNGITKAIIDDNSKARSQTDEFLSQVCRHDPQCYYYRQRDEAIEKIIRDSAAPFYDQAGIKLYNLKYAFPD
jgi:4-amino-4-deoxy-L-arabinose transferase-like glycosyltransferase